MSPASWSECIDPPAAAFTVVLHHHGPRCHVGEKACQVDGLASQPEVDRGVTSSGRRGDDAQGCPRRWPTQRRAAPPPAAASAPSTASATLCAHRPPLGAEELVRRGAGPGPRAAGRARGPAPWHPPAASTPSTTSPRHRQPLRRGTRGLGGASRGRTAAPGADDGHRTSSMSELETVGGLARLRPPRPGCRSAHQRAEGILDRARRCRRASRTQGHGVAGAGRTAAGRPRARRRHPPRPSSTPSRATARAPRPPTWLVRRRRRTAPRLRRVRPRDCPWMCDPARLAASRECEVGRRPAPTGCPGHPALRLLDARRRLVEPLRGQLARHHRREDGRDHVVGLVAGVRRAEAEQVRARRAARARRRPGCRVPHWLLPCRGRR